MCFGRLARGIIRCRCLRKQPKEPSETWVSDVVFPFEDMGQGLFDVVAVTDKPGRAHALVSSVKWPLRLRLLQPPPSGRPWKYQWFDAERYLLTLGTCLEEELLRFLFVQCLEKSPEKVCWQRSSSAGCPCLL